ncbi:hypothetical protein BWQ96_01975 [Gracilariopsis chorda]|uniref:Uncharacterized protein n=1 Tax=Gracilariopsis chorda TaxID=448386 RepID=A0A2V3J1J1_9FLOR|nr:hypothetical protein BWQ96_01975 [Gracilariopsis chorda]|eukprot:PXF48286.1 hypothetical protein BWQ96_01975 [Gracilariopsis chorda]
MSPRPSPAFLLAVPIRAQQCLPRRSCARLCANARPPGGDRDNADLDPQPSPALSRRVFVIGTTACSALVLVFGTRLFFGDDVVSRLWARTQRAFPNWFPPPQTAEQRRKTLDVQFATAYFAALQNAATRVHIISAADLKREEALVQRRALPLFFAEQPPPQHISNTQWFNFLLYARVHAIAQRTSPASRSAFVREHARQTLSLLSAALPALDAPSARAHPERWLGAIRALLQQLSDVGWISAFRVEPFDSGPGSSWFDEGRSTLTVFAMDPVCMQCAQLIGEEQYEQLSPKVSPLIAAMLSRAGIECSYEDYYVDDTFRADTSMFSPSQIASQFDISLC